VATALRLAYAATVSTASSAGRVAQQDARPIFQRQNDPALLKLLRADTWHYRLAKRWHLARIAGSIGFAAAAPVITFWWHSATVWVAVAAGAWVLIGRTVMNLAEQREVHLGATVQEQFDTDLFRMEWNGGLAGPKPTPEDVTDAARHVSNVDRLRNWYADTGQAPWPLDVVLCQRSSAVWGRREHAAYGKTVLALGVIWFAVGIVCGLAAHVTLGDYLLRLFLPSQPVFLDTIDLFVRHREQSSAKEAVEGAATSLWAKGVGDPGTIGPDACRQLQDQVYRIRRMGLQIPEWFYRLHRERNELAMTTAVGELLAQLPSPAGPANDE